MREIIIQYLVNECGKNEVFVKNCLEKMEKHPDVMSAFVEWISVRDFNNIHAPTVCGIDVMKLHNTGKLTPVGVFNYLIYLRNNPKEALDALEKGLPRK